MAELHVLRVFCGKGGAGGNPLGVFLAGREVPTKERQRVAAELGFSETVFVDDAATGAIRIHTPATELSFAGHPTVGTAWLLSRSRAHVEALRPPAGAIPVRQEDDLTFVVARPEWGPPYEFTQLPSAGEVEALAGPPGGHDLIGAWAWLDEAAGVIRERVFCDRIGIAEDEATGAAALRLCSLLGRAIEIRQGRASLIFARPLGDGRAEVGGAVVLDEMRDYRL